MKDLVVVDDAPVFVPFVPGLDSLDLYYGGLLLNLLVNFESCYSSFKCLPRGHLHEILGLRATGAFSTCVGVHDAAFELMTRQHMTLTDSMAKGTTLGPCQKATSAWQARVDTQGIG